MGNRYQESDPERWVPPNIIVRINCLVCGKALPTGEAELAQSMIRGRWETVAKRPQASYPVNAALFIRDHEIPGEGPHIILGVPDPRICPSCHQQAEEAWTKQEAMKKKVKVVHNCFVCGKHSNYLSSSGADKGNKIYLCSKRCSLQLTNRIAKKIKEAKERNQTEVGEHGK